MSVGCCQLRDGVVWNADDCRKAEAQIKELEEDFDLVLKDNDRLRAENERLHRVVEAARALVESWETDSHGFRQGGYEDCAQALRAALGREER